MHSAFNLFVFPNSMFTALLFCFCLKKINIFYERAMSSAEKYHLKITIIIIIIKEWKLYSNINSAKHLFCNSPVCAYRQLSNLKRMLVKSNLSRIPTLVGNSKCMKPHCQVCDMLDTRNK